MQVDATPLLVANLLLLPVSLDGGGMSFPVVLPVVGIPGAPLLGTIETDLPVFGVNGDLPPVVIGAAAALASGVRTDGLLGLILRMLEDSFAIGATPFGHNGGCPTSWVGGK